MPDEVMDEQWSLEGGRICEGQQHKRGSVRLSATTKMAGMREATCILLFSLIMRQKSSIPRVASLLVIHNSHCQLASATTRKSSWSDVIGLCQPLAGETLCSTSPGPQVPFSYSKTGVLAFSTGSTIRQASST